MGYCDPAAAIAVSRNRQGHPSQCKLVRKNGTQCKRWRDVKLPDGTKAPYCKVHNRHNPTVTGGTNQPSSYATKRTMERDSRTRATRYGKRLGPKLKAFVEEQLASPESDQLSLFEELAVIREIAGTAIECQSKVDELQCDTQAALEKKLALLDLTSKNAISVLHDVRTMADTAARIRATAKDQFSAGQLHDVVNQITKIVELCFNQYPKELRKFEKILDRELRLPRIGVEGTSITPDQDVLDIDSMIPESAEAQEERDSLDSYDDDSDLIGDSEGIPAQLMQIENEFDTEIIQWPSTEK